jgi:hypothetical protein
VKATELIEMLKDAVLEDGDRQVEFELTDADGGSRPLRLAILSQEPDNDRHVLCLVDEGGAQ